MVDSARQDAVAQDAHVDRAREELRQHATSLVQAWEKLHGGHWNAAHGRGLQLAAKQLVRACERLRLSLSRKAGELETFIRVFVDTSLTPNPEQLRTLSALVSTLASTVLALEMVQAQAQTASAEPASSSSPPVPAVTDQRPAVAASPAPVPRAPRRVEPISVPRPRSRRMVNGELMVLVGEASGFGADLAAAFCEHGYAVRSFAQPQAALEALGATIPRAIVCSAAYANAIPALREAAKAVTALGEDHNEPGLAVITTRPDIGRRLVALRQGVKYFEPPLDPLAVLVTLTGETVQPGTGARVLLMDREASRAHEAATWLKNAGHTVRICVNSGDALDAISTFKPQVAVVDAEMPGADSMRLVHGLRDDASAREIPIILVASSRELAMREQAIAGGADEYLLRPVKPRHLLGVIESRVKRAKRFAPRSAARRDETTGLYPRREFIERAEAAKGQPGAVVLYLALDEHETLRKQLGISGQSRLDIAVGEALKESLRAEDLPALYQDCRYLALLRRADRTDAMAAAENLRESLSRRRLAIGDHEISLHASLGLATLEVDSADTAVRNAEAAALAGLHLGGNRSMWFESSRASLVPAERDSQLRALVQSRRFALHMELRGAPWLPLRGRIPGQYELQYGWRPGGVGQPAVAQAELAAVAREAGCAQEFDRFLVAQALQARAEQLKRGRQLRLVVEVSTQLVEDAGFSQWLAELLREQRLSGTGLALLLPASVLADRAEALISLCQQMKPLAVRVGLKDIGRDITLVHRLRGVPLDFLRLSPELSVGSASSDRASELLSALTRKAHQAGTAVIACAVENREQVTQLHALGVDYAESPVLAGANSQFDFEFSRWSPAG